MPLQGGLRPDEGLVEGGLGVNGHNNGPPYENGYPGEGNRRESSIVPIVSDITPSLLPNGQQSANHISHPSPIGSRLSAVVKSSPTPSGKSQNFFSSPASRRDRNDLSLETVLPTRLQSREAEGSPAAGAAISNMSEKVEVAPQQPRKRGRPKGWKPGTPYNSHNVGGTTPANKPIRKAKSSSAVPSQEPRRRGRPPKPPELTIREWYLRSDPKYMPFGCEWHEENLKGQLTQCPAELQNMDTLRKHVFLIHCNADEPLVCRWGKCDNRQAETAVDETAAGEEATTDDARHQQPEEFEDEDAFCAHIEKEHLKPYVWHMGDGPQNKGIWTLKQEPNELPRYLFDQDGNQVTPSIKDQQFEDTQGTLERKRRLRAIRRQALENAPDESEFFLQPEDTDT